MAIMTRNSKVSNIHKEWKEMLTACKRQSESLNDVSSSGSFHDGGAYLPALLSNFDNFISHEKTPHYESAGSRKSRVNPIVAGELESLRVERQNIFPSKVRNFLMICMHKKINF